MCVSGAVVKKGEGMTLLANTRALERITDMQTKTTFAWIHLDVQEEKTYC